MGCRGGEGTLSGDEGLNGRSGQIEQGMRLRTSSCTISV